jgi:predicted HAD superfamily Cof-like phosphohydrolase
MGCHPDEFGFETWSESEKDLYQKGLAAGRMYEVDAVEQFHFAAGQPVRDVPTVIPDDEVRLRARLILEEVQEALESMFDVPDGGSMQYAFKLIRMAMGHYGVRVDLPNLARELTDIGFVVTGTQVQMGLPKEECFDEVNRANADKFREGVVLKDGKVQKPEGWTPPDVGRILRAHGWEGK